MPPASDIRIFQKRVQLVLSTVLVLIVIGLIGGYIYVGMYMAKQGGVAATPTEDVTESRVPTAEEKQAIIVKALQQNNTNTPPKDPTEKATVVSGLEKNNSRTISEGERQQVYC